MKKYFTMLSVIFIFLCFTMCANAGYGYTTSSEADAKSTSEAINLMDASNHSKVENMGAPIPGNVSYGQIINYFGKPLPTEGFQPVEMLLMYDVIWFTEDAMKALAKKSGAEADFRIIDTTLKPAPIRKDSDGKTRWIKVFVSRSQYQSPNLALRGYVTARSTDKKDTMANVFGAAGVEAIEAGCNVMHITAQGAARDVFSSGWGVGANTTIAQSFEGNLSGVGSAGTGYSSSTAGIRDLPWFQAQGLIDYNLEPPPDGPHEKMMDTMKK